MKIKEIFNILTEEPHLELKNNQFVDMGLERIKGKNKIDNALKTIGILYRFIFKHHKIISYPHGEEFIFSFDNLDDESKELIKERYELEQNFIKNKFGEEEGNHLIHSAIKKAKQHHHNHIYIGHKYFN